MPHWHPFDTIVSIGAERDDYTMDHARFDGIEKGEMAKEAGLDDAELSGLAEGDEVAFRVKHDSDGANRIMSICKPASSGAGCLEDMREK